MGPLLVCQTNQINSKMSNRKLCIIWSLVENLCITKWKFNNQFALQNLSRLWYLPQPINPLKCWNEKAIANRIEMRKTLARWRKCFRTDTHIRSLPSPFSSTQYKRSAPWTKRFNRLRTLDHSTCCQTVPTEHSVALCTWIVRVRVCVRTNECIKF